MDNLVVSLDPSMVRIAQLIYAHASAPQVITALKASSNLEWPTPGAQEALNIILCHSDRFPLSTRYVRSLLKCIENTCETLEDCLMERVLSSVCMASDGGDEDDEAYFSYYLPVSIQLTSPAFSSKHEDPQKYEMVPLRVQRTHNQVGLRVWEAGLFLAEVCLAMPSGLFADKSVLELGAGIGLTGILLARGLGEQHAPKNVVLTDWAEVVLENIRHNVNVNFGVTEDASVSSSRVEVKQLDWRAMTSMLDAAPLGLIDVTLIADCTYSEEIIDPLLGTVTHIAEFWHHQQRSPSACPEADSRLTAARCVNSTLDDALMHESIVKQNIDDNIQDSDLLCHLQRTHGHLTLLACTHRSDETFAYLQKALNHLNMTCRDLTPWAQRIIANGNQMLPYANRERIHFYCLHM